MNDCKLFTHLCVFVMCCDTLSPLLHGAKIYNSAVIIKLKCLLIYNFETTTVINFIRIGL